MAYSGNIALYLGCCLRAWRARAKTPIQRHQQLKQSATSAVEGDAAHKFHAWLAAANAFLSASEWRIEPVVCSSPTINESRPVKMDAADQAGFHEPGWKLENCERRGGASARQHARVAHAPQGGAY